MHVKNELILLFVGDVAPMTYSPAWEGVIKKIRGTKSIFSDVEEVLKCGDLVFCQLEIPISDNARFSLPQARRADFAKPETAELLREAGFNVVSFASNHCMDWGPEVLLDTIAHLKHCGIAVIGVGRNISEAMQPYVAEKDGIRIGFLAFNSILPIGYWAEEDRPGCAPIRVFTVYEPIEYDQPGTPCRIRTFPHPEDLNRAVKAVKELKNYDVNVIVVSLHWGIHFVPAVLADYQRQVAYTLIDAGADIIIGHHPHIIKAIEIYKEHVILYSVGNFALDLPFTEEMVRSKGFLEIQSLNPDWRPDPSKLYNLPYQSRWTFIGKCTIDTGGLKEVSLLPCYIDDVTACPRRLNQKEEKFWNFVRHLKDICLQEHVKIDIVVEGSEVIVWKRM